MSTGRRRRERLLGDGRCSRSAAAGTTWRHSLSTCSRCSRRISACAWRHASDAFMRAVPKLIFLVVADAAWHVKQLAAPCTLWWLRVCILHLPRHEDRTAASDGHVTKQRHWTFSQVNNEAKYRYGGNVGPESTKSIPTEQRFYYPQSRRKSHRFLYVVSYTPCSSRTAFKLAHPQNIGYLECVPYLFNAIQLRFVN